VTADQVVCEVPVCFLSHFSRLQRLKLCGIESPPLSAMQVVSSLLTLRWVVSLLPSASLGIVASAPFHLAQLQHLGWGLWAITESCVHLCVKLVSREE